MEGFGLVEQLRTVKNTFWHDPDWRKVPRSARQTEHLKEIHKAQTDRAVERYAEALTGQGWVTTAKLEALLGMYASECNAFLRKLYAMGVIERRPRGNAERYIRNRGWEWKWKEIAMEKELKDWIDAATYEEMQYRWKTDQKDSPIYNPAYAACVYFRKQMKAKMGRLSAQQVQSINRLVDQRIELTQGGRRGIVQSGQPRDTK